MTRASSRGWPLVFCISLACGPGEVVSDGGETTAFGTDGEPIDCTPAEPALAVEVIGSPTGNLGLDIVVTEVEQDPDDARRWTIGFEGVDDAVVLQLMLDPPLDEAPFEVGEQLTGIIAWNAEDGGSAVVAELSDPLRWRLSLADYRGPSQYETFDEPIPPYISFDWTPSPCTHDEPQCGSVTPLVLEIRVPDENANPSTVSKQLVGPSERHVEFDHAIFGPMGVWLGETWEGDCDGLPHKTIQFAVLPLP